MAFLDFREYTGTWPLKFTATVPTVATGAGMCFDGLYFWILDGDLGAPTCHQMFLTDAGTLSSVSSFPLNYPLGGAEQLYNIGGITTDGLDLWISYTVQTQIAVGPPPVFSQQTYLSKWSKSGSLLYDRHFAIDAIANGSYGDLSWDGLNLIVAKSRGPHILTIPTYQFKGNPLTQFSLARVPAGIAFNGHSILGVLDNSRATQYSRDGKQLTTNPLITAGTVALEFGMRQPMTQQFMDLFDAEPVIILRN